MPVYTTACPRNCYSTCSMKILVRNGKLRMIEPDAQNLATPEGVCLKGLSYIERVYSPDRILDPLIHNRKNGKFEKAGWETVLEIIAGKINLFKQRFGAQSILYYTGSGTKGLVNQIGKNFWEMIGGYTTTYGDLCWPAGLEATRLTLGENKHNVPWDITRARLIIMWGKNPAETNIHQMLFIDQALEAGAKLVVIDPRRTQSAEKAHLLIRPRPGSDGALALSLANLVIKNNVVDVDFIKNNVLGFEEFSRLAGQYSPEHCAKICDIPVSQIYALATLISSCPPVTINAGYGMQRYTNSGQTMRAIIALLAITGNIGKSGAGWIFANLQSHIFDHVKDPLAFYPPENKDKRARISISTARLGTHILQTTDPPIKMIWVERGNPVTQNPNTNQVLKAFRSLEFVVVIDQFMTDTAREADIILPAKTMFEQSDVIGAYWHPYIQFKQKLIDPPGKVKPESEIYYLLGKKLGYPVENMSDKFPPPDDDAVEKYLKNKLRPFPDLTLEQLRHGPVLAPGNQEIAFEDLIFPTPSGKIELVSDQAAKMWKVSALPDYFESAETKQAHADEFCKYPLYLMTPNTKNRIHSQFNNLNLIRRFSQKPKIYMHAQDMACRKISPGDNVRIFNERGELSLPAEIDLGLKPGCVVITNGWWISEGGTVNFCSADRETDMGYGAAFHDNMVQVERVE